MKLNEEQRNLISALEHGSRKEAVKDLLHIIPHLDDEDMKEICAATLERLDQMSDEEFESLDLTIPEEDEDE
ncbi:MAG: transposon-transfer assisting family protein [Eubacteriales bacterium]|nr:transposon-transfer assisting family protein [Eubacteriales bacterium]